MPLRLTSGMALIENKEGMGVVVSTMKCLLEIEVTVR